MNIILKKRALHRAKILEGQMRGLTKAIQNEEYCVDLLVHSLTIRESLKSLNQLLLENHLKTHVKSQLRRKETEEKAVRELVRIFSLSSK